MVEYMKGPAPRMVIYDAVNYNHARRMTVYQKVVTLAQESIFVWLQQVQSNIFSLL